MDKPTIKWPTLEGRLNHPITTRGEALLQMKNNGDVLTPLAERYLAKFLKENVHIKRKSSLR